MTLVKQNLKVQIKNLANKMKNELDSEEALEKYAEELSTIIHNYILSATVIVNPGQAVTTNTGIGTTTSAGSGKLK